MQRWEEGGDARLSLGLAPSTQALLSAIVFFLLMQIVNVCHTAKKKKTNRRVRVPLSSFRVLLSFWFLRNNSMPISVCCFISFSFWHDTCKSLGHGRGYMVCGDSGSRLHELGKNLAARQALMLRPEGVIHLWAVSLGRLVFVVSSKAGGFRSSSGFSSCRPSCTLSCRRASCTMFVLRLALRACRVSGRASFRASFFFCTDWLNLVDKFLGCGAFSPRLMK